jgi:hypothetical protein
MDLLVDEEALMQMLNLILNNTYEKLHPLKTHYPTTKTQRTTHIQLFCNYFLGIITNVHQFL